MSKIILKKIKKIISMYFDTKSYLKSNRYHTAKHIQSRQKEFSEREFGWLGYDP